MKRDTEKRVWTPEKERVFRAAMRYYAAERRVLGQKPGDIPERPYQHLNDAAFSLCRACAAHAKQSRAKRRKT